MTRSAVSRQLILVRHAATEWNVPGRLNSTTDLPLSESGRAQATDLAGRLVSMFPAARVWTSPAARARETAEAIAKTRGVDCVVLEDAREVDFGRFEGSTRVELMGGAHAGSFDAWESGGTVEGVESLTVAAVRAHAVVERMLADAEYHAHILVSHGVFLRVLICAVALDCEPSAYRRLVIDNAALSLLREDDRGVRLVTLNSGGRLSEGGAVEP